jgi:uncharacterized phage protein gp47/JayE
MTEFVRPPRSDLIVRARSDINARVTGADSRLRRSFLSAMAAMHAGGMDGLYAYLDYIADQVMPDSADSAHLERWASIWRVARKTATAAIGSAISAASVDTTPVAAGTLLQRGDGLTYATAADAVVAGGTVTVAIVAQTIGQIGGALAGVQLELVSPIAGVVGPFTVVADMEAADAELDPQLLGRLLARIQDPPKGGGPGDYVGWALEVPGVTRAWEYPLRMGLGTVGVAFVFDARVNILPLLGDVAAMQVWLDTLDPVTADVTAFAVTSLAVDFTINIVPDTAATRAAVTAELVALFARESAPETTVLRSHYDQAVGIAAGVTDYTVSVPAANVVPAAGQLPVLGAITWV